MSKLASLYVSKLAKLPFLGRLNHEGKKGGSAGADTTGTALPYRPGCSTPGTERNPQWHNTHVLGRLCSNKVARVIAGRTEDLLRQAVRREATQHSEHGGVLLPVGSSISKLLL